jgi:hypothetical protein
VIFDPDLITGCNVRNSLAETLERYWRWYAGKDEVISAADYWAGLRNALTVMLPADLRAQDFTGAAISLLCPHYRAWKSCSRRLFRA